MVSGGDGLHAVERLDGVLFGCGRGKEGPEVSVGKAGGLQVIEEDPLGRCWGGGRLVGVAADLDVEQVKDVHLGCGVEGVELVVEEVLLGQCWAPGG